MSPPSLLKIPLLLAVAGCYHVAFTSPNGVPPSKELARPRGSENFIRRFKLFYTYLFKGVAWTSALSEAAVILAEHYPSSPLARQILQSLIPGTRTSSPTISVPASFILGFILATSGGLLRYWCYRTLGRFFTFELSIRPGHRLVTDGPYSVVRHPSYAGALLCGSGVYLSLFSRGSWLRESGVLDNKLARGVVISYMLVSGLLYVALARRPLKEDDMMKKEFGKEWDEWAGRVPYRLFPGIY
ncbi:hypothetical protein JAAARDRAFT_81522 [Jaapia argillacea MUCL 33604]|uniref:Protein-S-isoprenylcysteine O-methyltransferase n=1 Tax=Jaapia argillacea MUCL 33604 TaxID=933084 RepID=A0A067PL89_9AGAM|nr:hypothetical protein JAAARDRAFT_81522 [Jaapia argillacea MUCL 33604]